mmetsp:Transcript_18806/g.23076  ORF Transcript_18806/g.23076 Transcript_18806/m.23076 type:complete len:235 (-) Transcript_18806:75-779(-)
MSDDITEVLKRLATLKSTYRPELGDLQSTVFDRIGKGESVHMYEGDELSSPTTVSCAPGENSVHVIEDDEVSSPTVSCASFSDDDFSLESDLFQAGLKPPYDTFDCDNDDDISVTSLNSAAVRIISIMKQKQEILENTKLELLNQCMRLESQLEKVDCNVARARILKKENAELRDKSAEVERDMMNEMNKMVLNIKNLEEDCKEKLKEKDDYIRHLEEENRILKENSNENSAVT